MAITTQINPNIQTKEALKAFFYFSPIGWPFLIYGSTCKKLSSEIKKYLKGEVFLFDSGRSAFYEILKSLPKSPRNEVMISAYTCIVVINAILKAGLKPIYIDTNKNDPSLSIDDLSRKISSKTLALVTQNTFGFPEHMNEILEICKEKGILLIEDLAHSLTATYNKKPLGTFGDAAFISFGAVKVLSSGAGGAAIIHDKEIVRNMKSRYGKIKQMKISKTLKHLYKILVFQKAKVFYTFFNLGKAILYATRKLNLTPPIIEDYEKSSQVEKIRIYKMPNSLASIALTQWRKKDKFFAHRQEIAQIYEKHLKRYKEVRILEQNPNSAYLFYPIFTFDPKKLYHFLKKYNTFVSHDWTDSNIVPKDIDKTKLQYAENSCPNAENLALTNLNLPTHIHITERKALQIIDQIHEY